MNYEEVKTAALAYADRKDNSVINQMDTFITVVEARINRVLSTREMSARATINMSSDVEYYGLPCDFKELRDIEVQNTDGIGSRVTAQYLNPEQMNAFADTANTDGLIGYTIIADQLQVRPPLDDKVLEIVYLQRLPNLSTASPSNWLSENNPDAYIFGLLVEINSYIKDAETVAIWESRFNTALGAISNDDAVSRWSGTPLQVKVG